MSNPLDNFKSATVTTNEFRVPRLPLLFPLVKAYGPIAGAAQFDSAMEDWAHKLEKQISDKLAPKAVSES